jgi:hypothetical protein
VRPPAFEQAVQLPEENFSTQDRVLVADVFCSHKPFHCPTQILVYRTCSVERSLLPL